jgi:hypothetical protein
MGIVDPLSDSALSLTSKVVVWPGLKITAGQRMPLDRSFFNLIGHFDRPHFHAFQCDCRRLELKHETMMYRNKFLIVCFTVSVSVSMTGQIKRINDRYFDRAKIKLTDHFDQRPTVSPVILSPASGVRNSEIMKCMGQVLNLVLLYCLPY